MKKTILLLILILWEAVSASAQLYRQLDTHDGLSSRRVWSIEKDKQGYLWFLTSEGADRYNGKQFAHYPLMLHDKKLQQFPNINSLHTDTQGNVWVLGKNGYFYRYDTYKDRYELVLDFAEASRDRKRIPLTLTYMDPEDNVWIAAASALYIYRTRTRELVRLKGRIEGEVNALVQTGNGSYYLATTHRMAKATIEGDSLTLHPTDSLLRGLTQVNYLYHHAHGGRLIIGTLTEGAYMYTPDRHTLQPIGNLKDVNINSIIPHPESNHHLLVATDGNGLYSLDTRTAQLQPLTKESGTIVKDLHMDSEGRIWMATFPNGIAMLHNRYPDYEWWRHTEGNTNSPVNDQVTCLMEDSEGDIWIATADGVGCYDTRRRQWNNLLSAATSDGRNGQNRVFISLCEAAPGTILVGGYMAGMYRISKHDRQARYLAPRKADGNDIRPDKYIRSICRDAQGNVWAGGYYNFKRIDPDNGETELYTTEYPITVITPKNADELWIGTTGGLYTFDKRRKKMMQANLAPDTGPINTILQDGEQTTYIGTGGKGLYVYDNQTQTLENYITTNSALICNNICCILPGDKRQLVISTENELVCFDTKEKIFLNWTQEQGLIPVKFNTAAGLYTHDDRLIFGTTEGMVVIPDSIRLPRSFESKMVLSDLNIHYRKVLPGEQDSPLTHPINETREMTLKHDQNIFSIDVSSINYECPTRILYSWKLDGFFEEWTTPSEAHLIRYTNIDPGEYKLKVRSILKDDGHILEERELLITVEPPFSQSIWAMMIYTVLLALAAAAVMRFLWMRKDSQMSKEKIRFFIHTAHDIRTPLTLIKAPLSEIGRRETLSTLGRAQLDMAIHSTDKLAELATKLIEFQKEEMYTPVVNVTLCELNAYVKDFIEEFAPYAQQKGISLETDLPPEPVMAWIDRNKTDSILHNLVSNALKYTPEGGQISVKLRGSRTHWFLRISDTGIGIPAADQKKMFKHLFRGDNAVNQQITGTGIGMLQTYRLVKRHRGRITVTSQENEGTTFRLRFPLDDKRYKKRKTTLDPRPTPTLPVREGETIRTAPLPHREGQGGSWGQGGSSSPTLLIVEDHTDLRDFLRQTLSGIYRIREAANGQEALDLIAHEQPDLVLSDIMMPVMRGDDLCRTLKNDMQTSHIPVILLTALNDRESIIHGLEIKADSYVVKPFDVDILKANIASVLANKELVRQRFARMDYRTEDLVDEVPGVDLDQEFIVKVTETVKKNLGNDFNVDSLCSALNMSRSSFYNKIKALTDQSPSDFVRQIRLNEACTMLKSRKYTVAEVSDRLGYNDPKYFTELFKKHYGMTPSAYMKS